MAYTSKQEVRSMARFVFLIIYKLLHSVVEREEGNNCLTSSFYIEEARAVGTQKKFRIDSFYFIS